MRFFPTAKVRIRRFLLFFGFAGALVLLVSAYAIDLELGRDVLLVAPNSPQTIELNREMFMDGDSVAEIYGNPLSKKTRVILPSKEKLIRPAEDPSLLLLSVDKQSGENPLQAQTIWFFVQFAAPGLLLMGIVGLLLPWKRPSFEQEIG